MKASHLKLILLILFLSVNVFFLFKLTELYNSKNLFSEEEIQEAVNVLKDKGINISPDKVIKEKNLPSVIKLNFDSLSSEGIAKRVMREKYSAFTVPDGFSYTGVRESLTFQSDYSINYTYLTSNLTKEKVLSNLTDTHLVDDTAKKECENLSKTLFTDINSEPYSISLTPLRSKTVDSVIYVEAIQTVNKYKIDKAKVVFATKDGELLFLSGTLFFAQSYEDYLSNAFDSINILFEIEDKKEEITSMEVVYSYVFDENNSVYLTPSYAFTYADNTKEIYDATSAVKRYS